MFAFMPLLAALAVAFCCISTFSLAQSPSAPPDIGDAPRAGDAPSTTSPPPGPRAIPERIETSPRSDNAAPRPADPQIGSDVRDGTPPFNPEAAKPPTPLRVVPSAKEP